MIDVRLGRKTDTQARTKSFDFRIRLIRQFT
jgi:hypothetical protein